MIQVDPCKLILLLRNNTELPPIMKHNKLKNIVNHINDNYGSIEKCFQVRQLEDLNIIDF